MNKEIENDLMLEALKKGRILRFRALGSSMYPFIRSRDLVTIVPVNENNINLGDIIFYKRKSNFILHRLVEINKNNKEIFFITKGDFLPSNDEPFNITDIYGKVIKIERNKKSIDISSMLWKINEWVSINIPFLRVYNIFSRFKISISKTE